MLCVIYISVKLGNMITLKYRRASFLRAWVQELKRCDWDFPGGPEFQTSPSNAGGVGSIP